MRRAASRTAIFPSLAPTRKGVVSKMEKRELRLIAGQHRLWFELGRYLIAFEPQTFVLD